MNFDFLFRGHEAYFKNRADTLKKQAAADDKEAQALVELYTAYHQTFSVREGQKVLRDLFRNMDNTIMMGMALKEKNNDPKILYDEGRANIVEGRRRVLNEILDGIRIGEFL